MTCNTLFRNIPQYLFMRYRTILIRYVVINVHIAVQGHFRSYPQTFKRVPRGFLV